MSPKDCQYFVLSDPREDQFGDCCTQCQSIGCDRYKELQNIFYPLDDTIGTAFNSKTVSDKKACVAGRILVPGVLFSQ